MLEWFVGRRQAVEQFETALSPATLGSARAMTIVGTPGIGKSALLDELCARAKHSGGIVCRARAFESVSVPPLSVFPGAHLGSPTLSTKDAS